MFAVYSPRDLVIENVRPRHLGLFTC